MKLPKPAVYITNADDQSATALTAYSAAQMREYRNAALEEAAKVCEQFTHYGEASGIICVKAIRALKEVQS